MGGHLQGAASVTRDHLCREEQEGACQQLAASRHRGLSRNTTTPASSCGATTASSLRTSISRRSPGGDRRRSCSPKMKAEHEDDHLEDYHASYCVVCGCFSGDGAEPSPDGQ